MAEQEVFTWIASDGTQIVLDLPNYLLQAYDGFGAASLAKQLQRAPYQHGSALVDARLRERDMTLQVRVLDSSLQGLLNRRRDLVKAFNPLKGIGRLRWEQPDGTVYEIHALADEAPQFASGEFLPTTQMALIHLLAPDPLFFDPAVIEEAFQTFTGGQEWGVPVNLIQNFNFTFDLVGSMVGTNPVPRPDNWVEFASGTHGIDVDEITDEFATHGHKSFHVGISALGGAAQRGLLTTPNTLLPVTPGEPISARCKVRTEVLGVNSEARLDIEWYDAAQTFISNERAVQTTVTAPGTAILSIENALAPTGAAFMRVLVYVFAGADTEAAEAHFSEIGIVRGQTITSAMVLNTGGEQFATVTNELTNPGFEAALGAEWVNVGVADTRERSQDWVYEGAWSLKVFDVAAVNEWVGAYQEIPVTPGTRWSAIVRANVIRVGGSGAANPEVVLEFSWRDATGALISNNKVLNVGLGEQFLTLSNFVAPDLARSVRVQLLVNDSDAYFDKTVHIWSTAVDETDFVSPQGGQQFGTVAGLKEALNEGDVPAPVEIVFNGPATNPAAVNLTTSKRLQVLFQIAAGDKVRVNTRFGQRSVVLEEADGTKSSLINALSSASEFWLLALGLNEIEYQEEAGVGDIGDMQLSFNNWFVGA